MTHVIFFFINNFISYLICFYDLKVLNNNTNMIKNLLNIKFIFISQNVVSINFFFFYTKNDKTFLIKSNYQKLLPNLGK